MKTRDSKRIAELLQLLSYCWNQFPDMRFGQLLTNICYNIDLTQLYYVEDERFIRLTKEFMKDLNVPDSTDSTDSQNTSFDELETLLKQNKQNREAAEFANQAASKVCKKILEQYAGTDDIHVVLNVDEVLLLLDTLYDCGEQRTNIDNIRHAYNMVIDRITAPKEISAKKTKTKTEPLVFKTQPLILG